MNKDIVDVIIGEMYSSPDDDAVSKERALAIFEDVVDPEESEQDSDLQTDRYRIIIKNPIHFRFIIGYISGGASFSMASRFLLLTKEETGLASIGSIKEGTVANYVRFTSAFNLQKMSEILGSTWTFSLPMDMSTHMSTSYLDIRIRLIVGGTIHNLHLLAIPMFCSHTGEQIFLHASRALDVIFILSWLTTHILYPTTYWFHSVAVKKLMSTMIVTNSI